MTKTHEELRADVRATYGAVATGAHGCCGGSGALSMIGDAYEGVAGRMAEADLGLGCGLPVAHAGIRPGDTVLDLGSGAGNDAFIARREVGETGHVIGVDMTPEMIAKARANAAKLGVDNVEFRLGEIEHTPVETASVDVVVSNCVLNLVPEKRPAFAEMGRVTKPGGRFCISDIVSSAPLPEWTQGVADLYAGCVAGATPKAAYLDLLAEAGFTDVEIVAERRIEIPAEILSRYATEAQIAEATANDVHVLSVTVVGRKPDTQRAKPRATPAAPGPVSP